MRLLLQILLGTILCIGIVLGLAYSGIPFSWEIQYPDGSYPISWRSDLLLLMIFAASQWIAFLVFRKMCRRNSPLPGL